MNDDKKRLLSLLGIAKKAGKLSTGFESVRESLQKGKSKLVLCSADLSQKTVKELIFASKNRVNVVVSVFSLNDISDAVGTKTGCVSLNDDGFANAVDKLLSNKEDLSNDY